MGGHRAEASPRPLPRSLEPLAGESLGGYLLRLSCRLRVSPIQLARLTGCAGDGRVVIRRRLLLDLDVQRFAQAARLSADEAGSLALGSWADRYPPVARSRTGPGPPVVLDNWLFSTSRRYCPDCLAGNGSPIERQYGGPWKKIWHLPVVFACPPHRRFLREDCPRAHRVNPGVYRLIPFPSASALHPAQCRLPLQGGNTSRHRPFCGARLDEPGEDSGLPCPSRETLAVQERLLALLRPQHLAEDAARAFTDLRLIAALVCLTWPLARDTIDPCLSEAVSEHVRLLGTGYRQPLDRQPYSILATAGLLTAAVTIMSSPDLPATVAHHVQARQAGSPGPASWARVLDRHKAACSPALRDAIGLPVSGPRPVTASRRKTRTRTAATTSGISAGGAN